MSSEKVIDKINFMLWRVYIPSIVVLLVGWLIFSLNNPTEEMYGGFDSVRSYNRSEEYYDDENPVCFYPGCQQDSEWLLETKDFYPEYYPSGIDLLASMPNKAGFNMVADSFTYTDKIDRTFTDTNTYLIPEGGGTFRLETVEDKYVIQVDGETHTTEYIKYEGYYCDAHKSLAAETWRSEVEDTFAVTMFIVEHGLMLSLVAPLVGIGIFCAIYYPIQNLRKKKQEQT